MPLDLDISNVKKTLDILRETPADTSAASDKVLETIYLYLLKIPPCSDGLVHWFCKKANATTVDAATFLIRLMAYNSPQVVEWKKRLNNCLNSCAFCAQGFEIAKVTSRNTFLAAFSQDILAAFFLEFDKWEVKEVLEVITDKSTNDETVQHPGASIGTIYRMVSNWAIFRNPQVLHYLQSHIPSNVGEDWPDDPIPPGILVLLFAADSRLRSWAISCASRCKMIQHTLFTGSYCKAMQMVVQILKMASTSMSSDATEPWSITNHIQFLQSTELWPGCHTILKLIPPEWFKSNAGEALELKRTILSQLHKPNSSFIDVFRCFLLMTKRLSKEVWTGEGPEYPTAIFEAIDNNPVYMDHLCSPSPESGISNFSWIQEFLSTIRDYAYYGNVLDGVLNRLFEDTQNERLIKIRPSLASFITRTIVKELQRSRVDKKSEHVTSLLRAVEIHFGELVSFAYGQSQADQNWEAARTSAHTLIEDTLSSDILSIKHAVAALCRILAQKKRNAECDQLPTFSFRQNAWKTFYSTTRTPAGIANFVLLVSKVAYLDPVRSDVFGFANNWAFPAGDNLIKEINQAIPILQTGLSSLISTFSDYNVSDGAIDILQRPGVGKAVTLLLLSPVEEYHIAAKTLIGLAFDVDGRMECFRSLLENLADEALDGILEFLSTFHQYAATMPEASNISAALVRCFADILDILCASPDGLLLNFHFLRPKEPAGPSSLMPKFWKMLTKSLCIIYSRASMWAQYNDTTNMVLWMRDALILARDVLKQWRVIEKASNASKYDSVKPSKRDETSSIGRQMIESLQDFLPELIKWLRLTDEELLHQSFSLLQGLFDLMRETHVRPSEQALEKLSKHVEGALRTDSTTREQKTRLDQGRLLQLSEALSHFNKKDTKDSDDEVTIVSHTTKAKKPAPQIPAKKLETTSRNSIQGKVTSTKSIPRPTPSLVHNRSSSSKFFSEADQKELESSSSIPAFRKTTGGTLVPGPSKTIPDNRRPLTKKPEPKNEGLSRPVQSSDESSSSSSDSDDLGLRADAFRKSPKLKSPKRIKPVERRQIKTLDIPISDPSLDRLRRNKQAHLTAMRMRPDVSDLHRTILSWDYNHVGPTPPGEQLKLVSVPARFENYSHYFHVFRPLLLMECWAQLQQSREEKQDSYQCKVDSRQFADDWLDIDITITENVKKDWYLAETDVVLFRHPSHDKCLMGKVKSYKVLHSGTLAVVRCYIQSGIGDPGLQISTMWQISKVLSLSTLHREYGALVSLQYNDVCEFILRPSLPIAPAVNKRDVEETMKKYKLNEPQATAILKALKTEGFSLIQGPPGTGKTSTICSLIAQFLSQRPRAAVPIVVGRIPPSANLSRNPNGQSGAPSTRILVCAPSNAAIDEVAQRIKDGYVGSQKQSNKVNVVRVGAEQAISPSVRDISLDYLVDQKLDASPKPLNDIGNEIRAIREELESIKRDRTVKIAELTSLLDTNSRKGTLENEVKVLNSKRQSLINKLDSQKDKQKSDSRTLDTLRRNTRREVITQADVICSTLSGAGHDILENLDFDLIVIDEAAQAIELSSLIPLKYLSSRCVMVGDPQQLPPTVISQEASRFGYNQSLFVRLQQSQKNAMHLLSIQYRMHPDISALPSQVFYGGRLLDGPNMEEKTKQPWHNHTKFGTYRFLNVSWGIEEPNGHSIKNSAECNVAIELYKRLSQDFASIDFTLRIGVVSMYKAQIKALRNIFVERFGNDVLSKIDFNTVDGFQGQEKDIIILSCVRAGPGLQNVGFLSDVRRMNVALTRAKSSLFVLGNTATLERSDETWRKIVQDARDRSALINIDKSYFSRDIMTGPSQNVPPKNSKGSRKAPLLPSLPSDLSTPKELKASVQQKPHSASPFDSNVDSSSSSRLEPSRGIKRPSDATNPPLPADLEPPNKRQAIEVPPSHLDPLSHSEKLPPVIASSSSHSAPTAGMKRPLENDEPRGPNTNPPKPLPRKKPKQPQTMFIPKKRT